MMIIGVVAGIATGLLAVLIPWLPTSASEQMDRITFVYWFATVMCVGIAALVTAVIVYSLLKFRVQPDDDTDGPPIHGNTGLEIVWTAIPAVLVTAIAVVSAVVLARNEDAGKNPLHVDVTAQQFAWKFEYPAAKVTSGELVLPRGRDVKLTLRAIDVLHSFWVPEFGQKSDAVPGIETHLVITPTRLGHFSLICTELCGLGHATMRARVRVVEPAAYDTWVKEQAGGGAAAGGGADGAAEGASVFESAGCAGCHAFQPAGSDSQIGPPLDDLAAAAQKAGKPVEEFVRESITEPSAYLAPGYQAGVMPETYSQSLTDEQVDALVQYLTQGAQG